MSNNVKKKILLVTFSDNADHQEVIYSLFEELVNKHDVWAMGIKNPRVPYKKDKNIILVNAPKRPNINKDTFHFPEIIRILRFINKQKFDVIYFESLHTWNIPIWIFHAKDTKIIQTIHDVEPHSGDAAIKSVELMNKAAARYADVILLRDEMFIDIFQKKYKSSSACIKVLDVWRRFPEYCPEEHSHRALFFGRMNQYKGVKYLPAIVQKCPNVQFDIVGRAGPSVLGVVKELRKFSNVHLHTEYVSNEEMRQYFIKADFLILPYESASQSGVVVDANKFGRPPIAFAVSAISNQIESGINGILVPPGNVKAFAEAVNHLAAMSDEELDRFSKSTYDYAFERFSSKCIADQFIKMVEEI